MSGYRSLHRETLGSFPIWQVASGGSGGGGGVMPSSTNITTINNNSNNWRVFAACGDGVVRSYRIREKTLEMQTDVLDASAVSCTLTHLLVGAGQVIPSNNDGDNDDNDEQEDGSSSTKTTSIGISQVQLVRNYVGEDDAAGDHLVVSMDMVGRVRVWVIPEGQDDDDSTTTPNPDDNESQTKPKLLRPIQDFAVPNATGTCLCPLSPNISGIGDVQVAVPCLDGSVVLVAAGILTPKTPPKREPLTAGTVVETWSRAKSIALSGAWHPNKKSLAVGRQDGLVEILGERPHRLIHHEAPVRAITYTPDGNLLVTASDDGMLSVWDAGRSTPILVHHVVRAHTSWILSLTPLPDSRRFVSCGMDQHLNVWDVGQMHQATHTFTSDDSVWTIDTQMARHGRKGKAPARLVSGSEKGGLHIYSLEA